MPLLLLLPLLTATLLHRAMVSRFASRRDAALAAAVLTGWLVVAVTESLSAGRAFVAVPVRVAWAAVAAAVAALSLAAKGRRARVGPATPADPVVWTAIACIVAVLVPTAVVAAVSTPNDWDSMTYHLARVGEWVQHRSVAFYPTATARQVFFAPWAEYAVANLVLLGGRWPAANGVQFAAWVGAVVAASSVARRLGAGGRGQAVAALVVATLPEAILQASCTQTDLTAGFWLLVVVNFSLAVIDGARRDGRPAWPDVLAAGGAAGMALLTKTTDALFVAPFGLWAAVEVARRCPVRRTAAVAVVAGGLALLVNAPHLVRNAVAFGSPLGPAVERRSYVNATHAPNALLSNALRDVAVNLGIPGRGRRYSDAIARAITAVTRLDTRDPRITWPGSPFYVRFSRDESYAGNGLAVLLIAAAGGAILVRGKRDSTAAAYAVAVAVAAVTFCVVLRFQIWVVRLETPLFLAAAPAVGLVAGRLRRPAVAVAGCLVLTLAAVPFVVGNQTRPLYGSGNVLRRPWVDQMFAIRPDWAPHFVAATAAVRAAAPRSVGLYAGDEDWVFAVRRLLPPDVAIDPIGVTNSTRDCPPPASAGRPDAIVVMKGEETTGEPWPAAEYHVTFEDPMFRVLVRSYRE